MEGFLIRGWDIISPGGAGSSNLSQSAISQGGWVPSRAGQYRPGGPPFSSQVRWG